MKRILSVALMLFMIIGSLPVLSFAKETSIAVGDTITLGNYNGKPMEWICVLIDDNGPLMLSKDILCDKEYDAPGESAQYHSDGYGYVRKRSGSNCWSDSNIRQWLNSSGKVQYTHCPPSYSSEEGFLSGFSSSELANIKTVKQAVTVNEWETHREGYVDGGTMESVDVWNIPALGTLDISNYWFQYVEDKVFLLGEKQIYSAYCNLPDVVTSCDYLTRIANNTGASYDMLRIVYNKALGSMVAHDSYGIRPAFYLNSSSWEKYSSVGKGIFESHGDVLIAPNIVTYAYTATINGKEYDIKPDLLSAEKAETFVGKEVLFFIKNKEIVWIDLLSRVDTYLSCKAETKNITYVKEKNEEKNQNISIDISHCIYRGESKSNGFDGSLLKNFSDFDIHINSITLKTDNKKAINFDGKDTLTIDCNKVLRPGESTNVSAQISIPKKHKFPKNTASEYVNIEVTVDYTQNSQNRTAPAKCNVKLVNESYVKEKNNANQELKAAVAELEKLPGSSSLIIDTSDSLSKLFNPQQLSAIGDALLYAVALSSAPKERFEKVLERKVIEKVFDFNSQLLSVSSGDVSITVRVKTKDYGKITVVFRCKYDKSSLLSNEIAYTGNIYYDIKPGWAANKLPAEIKRSGSCGMLTGCNLTAFANAAYKIAESELKKAYNKSWGNDANKAVDIIFGTTLNEILSHTKYKSVSGLIFELIITPARTVEIKCPVDVYVYNSENQLVAAVEKNVVTLTDENASISVDGDEKTVCLFDDSYRIEYVSSATGTMNIEVSEYASSDSLLSTSYIENIPLEIGTTYTQTISNDYLNDCNYSLTSNDDISYSPTKVESTYHEHISNGEWFDDRDATCELDGLKYTYCTICGDWFVEVTEKATGHKDANNDGYCDNCNEDIAPEKHCTHICHKTGISRFFYKIALFFWKLFKINKECSCGALHY